ncbi:MAG: glycoside hydrolase family 38 C-terminal domain-containing protein [Bacteroidota bacterium]
MAPAGPTPRPPFSPYWHERITAEIAYAREVSRVLDGRHEACIAAAADLIRRARERDGAVAESAAREAEAELAPVGADAKRYRLLCAGHAHIDMNWMWRWDETVSITLETFRTVLQLMREYPEFRFSQSQASVYRIVEEYEPEMLEEIRARVREGRWEVTASTWVEADKNMPDGESLARHILYTRRYLGDLLGLDPDALALDFEPDTFGHSAHVPEILAAGGIRHYYHCRGAEDRGFYRWSAPSGRWVLAYQEPNWYNGAAEPSMVLFVPEFCRRHGLDTALRVYGVGDHGGGPTRRDLERLREMGSWPVFPTIAFGTYKEFFAAAEKIAARLPEARGERNFIFTGCYTSQSRIKRANRAAEAALGEAEFFGSLAAAAAGAPYPAASLAEAWRNTLFNQLHDNLPGSGTADTREYALGLWQRAMAAAGTAKARALRVLAGLSAPAPGAVTAADPDSTAEGAGVGFGVDAFRAAQCSRGQGRRRFFAVFNPSAFAREEPVEIALWDWDGDPGRLVCRDAAGRTAAHQVLADGTHDYWGHRYLRVLIRATVPPGGCRHYVLEEDETPPAVPYPADPRTESPRELVLENDLVRAVFHPGHAGLVSLLDKATGEELADPARPAGLQYVLEDDGPGMTAWVVGRRIKVEPLRENVRLIGIGRGTLRRTLAYETKVRESALRVTVALDEGRPVLHFTVEADWREIGRPGAGVPQLGFVLPFGFPCRGFRYDAPGGAVVRGPLDLDVPALSWAVPQRSDGGSRAVQLISGGGHGFRGSDDALSLTLLRSSHDPDPYPEFGRHRLVFALRLVPAGAANGDLIRAAEEFARPLSPLSLAAAGEGPAERSFFALEQGTAAVCALKAPEDGEARRAMVVRICETEGRETMAVLRFPRPVAAAVHVGLDERPLGAGEIALDGERIRLPLGAHRVATVRVEFGDDPG